MNSTFLNTINNKDHDYTPIWLMRQAGRYLPEYRKTREKAGSFLALCKNPDLATEVTLQPIRRFALDASIVFSDILVVPEAMGMHLYFSDGEGPKFTDPITSVLDVDMLKEVDPTQDLGYVLQTIKNLKQELPNNIPLIGFSGSPWTLACYMLEGGSSKNYEKIKSWLYTNPQGLHQLLDKVTFAVTDYLIAQIKAGVDTIMLFDSWGGILSENKFIEFSLAYTNKVINRIKQTIPESNIPSIIFTKGGGNWLEHMQNIDCNAIGLDWTIDIAKARSRTNKVLQGNIDPVILSVGDHASIYREVENIFNQYRKANNDSLAGHIFNLGHGILPSAKPDNVSFLIDTVHKLSLK